MPTLTSEKLKHIGAIRQLTAIMAGQQQQPQMTDAPTQRVATTSPPRVATTSNNITAPSVIRQMPLIHRCQTRSNNPFHLPADDDSNDDTVVASNCSPCNPLLNLYPSDLPVNPPASQCARRLANQLANQPPIISPSTNPPPHHRGCRASPLPFLPGHPLCLTPTSMTYDLPHLGCQVEFHL